MIYIIQILKGEVKTRCTAMKKKKKGDILKNRWKLRMVKSGNGKKEDLGAYRRGGEKNVIRERRPREVTRGDLLRSYIGM